MAYSKVVEMLGENLASFLELSKKWLVDWSVDTKKLFHFFHNIKKEDLIGLIDGTHQITKKAISGFVSELFQKTDAITVYPHPSFHVNKNSVMNFLEPVIAREKDLKNPDISFDNDIWNWFDGEIVNAIVLNLYVAVYRFIKNLTNRQILDEADRVRVKKVYSYLEALSIIREAILSGEVDKKGTGVIVYFNITGKDTLYRFDAFRGGGGRLIIDVHEVRLDGGWGAGRGACFSNRNFCA